MMRNPYVWRSVEELERERDAARDAGRDEILGRLADDHAADFREHVYRLIQEAARDLVAREIVPFLNRAVPKYATDLAENCIRDEAELLMLAMAPFTHHVVNDSEPRLRAFQTTEDGPLVIRSDVRTPMFIRSVARVLP